MYIIATFRSRNQTMVFFQIISSYGVRAQIVSTPRQAQVSCGVSVKIPMETQDTARSILARRRFDTFVGLFLVTEGINTIVKPLF